MDTDLPEELPALWSRRQAELFIARQTAGLQNNESSALPPAQLQNVIRQVLKANPEHYEAVSRPGAQALNTYVHVCHHKVTAINK